MKNVYVRRAISADRIAIMPLQKEIAELHYKGRPDLFRAEARYYSEEEFSAKLAHADHRIFVAEINGNVVGYAFAFVRYIRNHPTYVDRNCFYIDDICVAEKYRRHGVATALFEECRKQATEDGCANMELGVFAFNETAIDFYKAMGMEPMIHRMELCAPFEKAGQ